MAQFVRTTFIRQQSPGDVSLYINDKFGNLAYEIMVANIVAIYQDGSMVKIKTKSSENVITVDFSTPQESLVALQMVAKAADEIKSGLTNTVPPIIQDYIDSAIISGIADTIFEFHQVAASDTWFVLHNLNYKPAVTITDNTFTEIEGLIRHLDNNTILIKFNQQVSGWVLCS